MAKFDIREIKGVIPAMITPFNQDEELDEKKTRDLVEFLINKKVNGLYIGGSTGEGFLMDIDERKNLQR